MNYEVHCHGISYKELLSSVAVVKCNGNFGLQYLSLTIINSNFHHIIEFPKETSCSAGPKRLIIRNSGIMKIESEVLETWFYLDTLDLSYNEIQNTSFLTPLKAVQNLDLSHNRIEYFDMETFVMDRNTGLFGETQIDLSFNKITNFSSNNEILYTTSLNISHNHLTDLRDLLLSIRGLKIIDISYNQLREISTKNFPSELHLRYLNIEHNKLFSIDSEFFKFLRYDYHTDVNSPLIFIFSNNQLKNITIFLNNFYDLDEIHSLDYRNNQMETINFVKPPYGPVNIRSLTLRNNELSDLSGFNFTDAQIDILDLRDNNITYVPLKSFVNIRQSLDLSNNKISYINSSHFTEPIFLSRLNLSHNEIEILNSSTFIGISSLKELDLSHCILKQLDEESFSKLSNLKSLNLSFNFIESLPEKLFGNLNLKYLDLSHNFLTLLPGNIFSGLNLELIDLGFNQFRIFSETGFNNTSVKNLIARNNPIIKINKKSFFGLEDLLAIDLSNTGIKELRSNTFEKLERLNCIRLDDNEIQSLPVGLFGDQKNLAMLSMTGNNLIDLNRDALSSLLQLRTLNITLKGNLTQGMFRNLFNLYELNFVKSEITTIKYGSFSGLDMLQILNLENLKPVEIESGAFIGLSSLKIFNPRNWFENLQYVEEFYFRGLESVEHLNLSHFGIERVENNAFFGLISLESLNLSGNNINSLPINTFNGLRTLSSLDLSHNKLETIGVGLFSNLINLNALNLNHNSIRQIPVGLFTNLERLKHLNLSNNYLKFLKVYHLFPLKSLEELDVNFNEITEIDIDLKNYDFRVKLATIGIGYNLFNCQYLNRILENLQQRGTLYKEISKLEYYEENIDGIRCNTL
ncbi:hypothetical protein WA026_005841 [Henosepilachna vigintioctopunctata]